MSQTNGGEHLTSDMESDQALHKIRTAGAISISPELFEKLYLEPRSAAAPSGQLRKAVGNPTPIALGGFLLALTPLTNDLMNWRGAQTTNGGAEIAVYFFFGGTLMSLGGLLEWIIGNTFPATVFLTFGAFWYSYGGTLKPDFNAAGVYAQAVGAPTTAGTMEPTFLNAFAYFLVWMAVLCLIYLVCAIRTNIIFVGIFGTIVPAFCCLASAFFRAAEGDMVAYKNLIIAGGACAFVTCVLGWYLFAVILFASLDFPISFPVGDLSHIVKGKSELSRA